MPEPRRLFISFRSSKLPVAFSHLVTVATKANPLQQCPRPQHASFELHSIQMCQGCWWGNSWGSGDGSGFGWCGVVLESGMAENKVKTRTHNPMLECLGPVVRSKTILVFVEVSSVVKTI